MTPEQLKAIVVPLVAIGATLALWVAWKSQVRSITTAATEAAVDEVAKGAAAVVGAADEALAADRDPGAVDAAPAGA